MHGPSTPPALARAAALFDRDPEALAPRLRDGVLDLLDRSFAPTVTQRSLDTRFSAWLYDATRDRLVARVGMPEFPDEARAVMERLALAPGDVVLDVACGHGNFTAEFARRVGPDGLVIGLDIAESMLARAAARVRHAALDNVLLVRADALALPFRDGVFPKVNCSGGLHQMPDLGRALGEMARVAAPGARFAASGFAQAGAAPRGVRGWLQRRFALHFIPVERLAKEVAHAGFEGVDVRMAGPAFAYASGVRAGSGSS
jgi:SAM-dependent methyltransferase